MNMMEHSEKLIVVDPACGMSGDMFLAALVSLGVELEWLKGELSKLKGLEDFDIELEDLETNGILAKRAVVKVGDSSHERHLSDILKMLSESQIDRDVEKLSREVFIALAEAEGRVHGMAPEKVHFHEVGALDSIIDIVGAVMAIARLGFPRIYHKVFVLATGSVEIEHGTVPLPAPATLELLKGRVVSFVDEPFEIVTPTAAALMKVLAHELPASLSLVPLRVVYSTGSRHKESRRSLLRVIEAMEAKSSEGKTSTVVTTIDDMTPEHFGFLQERLLQGPALDVYFTQVLMKKSRPGVEVTVVCRPESVDEVVKVLATETTTIGMRIAHEDRVELRRWTEEVEIPFGKARVKLAELPDGSVKGAPEYEDCRELAIKNGVSFRDVYNKVMVEIERNIMEGKIKRNE